MNAVTNPPAVDAPKNSATSPVDTAAPQAAVPIAPAAAAAPQASVPQSATAGQPYFSVKDVHAYYGESYIVQGVTFDINESEIVALLGRNGAGKTTLLRTIARTTDPQLKSGEIILQGKAIHKMASHQAACSGIQLVPEDRRIIPGLTVEENIQLAQIAEPIGWTLERIYKHFPRLDERRKQEAITLSGGEQQMLAIARALARDLKLLLLDEPMKAWHQLLSRKSSAF